MPMVRVGAPSEIPPGHAKAFVVGNREIAVFNVDGIFYAITNTCPHQGGPLAEGWIEGAVVTCPWHAWCFDVRTGRMTLDDLCEVERFAVVVDGADLLVAMEPEPPALTMDG
jgi:nitrite reductase (NADH) small subunit